MKHKRLTATLQLKLCESNNPLMDNRVYKGQISRIFVSLFLNYERKSHNYGEISTL